MTAAPPLRALANAIAAEARLPDVRSERCVHDRIGNARCRACADACPRQAWIIDEVRLGIDIRACDGCGLCVPACPEDAIATAPEAAAEIRWWNDRPAVFYACERTDLPVGSALIPCLHGFGARELLRWYRRGVALLVVSATDCDACPRGTGQRLSATVRAINAVLQSRELPPLVLAALEPQEWLNALGQSPLQQDRAAWTRRSFFRGAVRAALNTAFDSTTREAAERERLPPTAWLPKSGSAPLFLHLPSIEPQRCNGCDACARLCPHQAIALERTASALRYRLEADRCSGCGICQDVCDQGAVRVESLRPQTQTTVALREVQCPACAVRYHLPTARPQADPLCPICARTRHGQHLYQVLN